MMTLFFLLSLAARLQLSELSDQVWDSSCSARLSVVRRRTKREVLLLEFNELRYNSDCKIPEFVQLRHQNKSLMATEVGDCFLSILNSGETYIFVYF